MKIGEERQAIVDIADVKCGSFREVGRLVRTGEASWVLYTRTGSRVFPLGGRRAEVYFTESLNSKADLVIEGEQLESIRGGGWKVIRGTGT